MTSDKLYIVSYDENEWPMDTMYYASQNELAENVLVVKGSDLDLLVGRSALNIIDKENSSDLINYTDDWIPENETKEKCFRKLKDYHAIISDSAEKEIVTKIIKIFEMSLDSDDAVCFIFQ
jgi:hypothetical protein